MAKHINGRSVLRPSAQKWLHYDLDTDPTPRFRQLTFISASGEMTLMTDTGATANSTFAATGDVEVVSLMKGM